MDRDKIRWHLRSRQEKFQVTWFFTGIISLSVMAWFFNSIAPKEGSVILLGIFLISCTLFCFLHSISKNVRRMIIVCSGVGMFLGLRALKLYDPLYVLLLLVFLASLEHALRKR